MKILHTADWHLGDKFNGVNRIDEQSKIIDEIIDIANENSVDMVLVCGDVYNTSNPSSEAEELFFSSIERLSNHGERIVFVISGNHDDPERLQAARGLANTHNIVLAGELDLTGKKYKSNSSVKITEAGYGYVKVCKCEEKVTLAFLPYSNNARMGDSKTELSYAEKVAIWIEPGISKFENDSFNMLAMHLFVAGSRIKGEEVQIGGVMSVPHTICEDCDYVALGHIHTNQKIGRNVYYSGSTIRRHVVNMDPSVNIITTKNNKLEDVKVIELKSPVQFARIIVTSFNEAETELSKYDNQDIIELVFKTSEPLSSSALKDLKKSYKCIRNIAFELELKQADKEYKQLRELSGEELFSRFYMKQRGVLPRKELVDFFIECGGDKGETD